MDGQLVAAHVRARIKKAIEGLKIRGPMPCLATILVGDDPASGSYVRGKQKAAAEVGIVTRDHKLSSDLTQQELIELIELLNHDNNVHGILVQLPLPKHIDEFSVINAIKPEKDVDGLTPFNAGMLLNGKGAIRPCTPAGIMELLDFYKVEVSRMDAVIVNRSNLVGKPLALLLLERNATVTVCHSVTKWLDDKLKRADIIVTAVGNAEKYKLTSEMVKDQAVVIDVGISRIKGKLTGDVVDFESVKEKTSWITPVPGGVGPMTVCMLLRNTLLATLSISKEMINNSAL
jgi:methylenetetrahydrofolate dehydrogenase (NADP+)/methenyltetrahydrofolate cyclohydrolase